MKKIFALLLAGTMLCVGLTACGGSSDNGEESGNGETSGNGGETAHTHTFEKGWTWDATDHWHKATCEHQNEVSEKNAHTMSNGKCSVCGYEEEKKSSLTEDTDFAALVSDRLTEEEWKAVFTDENFANATVKDPKDVDETYIMKHDWESIEKWTIYTQRTYVEDEENTLITKVWDLYENGIQIESMFSRDEWRSDSRAVTPEELNKEMADNPMLHFTCMASDFSPFYAMFSYDETIGAYVYDGDGIRVATTAFEYMGQTMHHVELKFKEGRLAYVHWWNWDDPAEKDKKLNDVYNYYYDYGTTKIDPIPEEGRPQA